MADGELRDVFNAFAAHGKTGATKTAGMDNKNWSKCCKDCKVIDGKTVTTTDVDIIFSKLKTKGARVITFEQFQQALTELAPKRFKASKSTEELTARIFQMVKDGTPKNVGVTKTSKTGGVAKMTDASQYTGAHKERFDASGKGKGIAGRENVAENSGYVGNYKGAGTYEDKVGN